ncbi:Phosphopantetheine adenylyltransferase [Promicromonospora umidemergens]|uniref:Phosphopantetheine adenylyltransferase n=1 Tax=Promicromonospora umidemergens TaxID=629679 RepID=A0ABP8X3S1_9MICO|nr:pantetheine-phosphate adenylyltransferase [Promicromonospora umidemergens]MCP2281164.1 Phosphopantetheine adenylyltransferase [Promicromonospora umidemergens]
MTTVVCPGSFDPITLGHLDIVRRTATMFDDVVVGVAKNPGKSGLLDLETRAELVRVAVHAAAQAGPVLERVRVAVVPGLLVDFCREVGAVAVVKGLRGGGDFDAEQPMALMNRHLSGVETIFLPGDQQYAHVASSLVKDIVRHGGPVDDLVPAGVTAALRSALGRPPAGS